MRHSIGSRAIGLGLAVALVAPALPAGADERTIKCESRDRRYQFCRADTDNRAELTRQLSRDRCVLWRSWGYDQRGVWVDNGCRAEFRVGRSGLSGGQTAAVIGGIAAAAIIAGIIAHKNGDNSDRDREVPDWAIGTFRGWDDRTRTSVELNISQNGSIQGWYNDDAFTGRWDSGQLYAGARSWRVDRDGDGLRLREIGNQRSDVRLWRTW